MTVWHSLVALRKRDQRRKSRRGNPQPLRRTLLLESLEDRRLLAYSATLVATAVTLSGDAAADTLTIDQDGAGLLRHNRFTAGDAGFVSDNDFISGNATDDTILASTVTDLAITDAGSNDSVVAAQSPAAAASTLNLSAGALSMSGFTSITDDGNLTVGGAASFIAATITLGGMSETTNFATLTFASAGAVTIQEDSSTAITGTNTAGSVSLTSDGAITDTGTMTSVTVTNDLIFNAGANSIVLADAATDVLSVGGNASFSGSSITIDSPGTANFATLTFTSTGAATINEDSSTALVGTSSGTTITVNSAGAMTDSEVDAANEITGTDLTLTGVGGIGAAGQPIHVAVTNLDVSNTTAGGIFVTDTAGGLTLTDLGGPNANSVNGVGGDGEIRANSPLTIAANAVTTGGMTYTAADSAAAGDNLTVNTGVTVQDTTASLTLNGGDNVSLPVGSTVDAATTVTINGDFGNADAGTGSTVDVFGTVIAATTITINTDSDADTVNLDLSTSSGTVTVNTMAGGDVINVRASAAAAPTTINGGDGNDMITLGSPANVISGILGQVQVNGGNHLAAPTMTDSVTAKGNTITRTLPVGDTLNINDQAYAAAAQYNLTDTMFDRDTTVARTMYATIETINLNAGTLVNDINIVNTPADSKTTVTSQGGADDIDVTTTGTGSILIINAAGGTDAVDIATTGGTSVTIVNGGDGADTLTQVTSGASSGVALNGQGDADTITIQNAGATSSSLATGGAADDGFTLWNLPASSFAQMDGDDDNDMFTLGSPANVISGILGQVQVNGGNHLALGGSPTHPAMIIKGDSSGALFVGDTLNVNDQAFAAAAQYNLTDTMFDRDTTVARTMYATVETVKLNAGTLANGINIANTVAGGTTTINGGSAIDTVIVTTTGDDSNVVINTGAGSDIVTIVGTGTDGADPNNSAGDNAIGSFLEVNGGAEAAPAGDTITLVANGVASRVQLDGEAGDDILNVQSTATGSRTQVSGDAGNDTINVSSDAPANLGNVNGIAGELMVDGGNNGPALRSIIHNATAGFSTTLMGGISAAATTVTIPLMTIPNLPAATPFQINVEGEDMLVNSVTTNAASMSLMVTRGAGAVAHANNAPVVLEVFTHVTSGSCVAAPVFIKQEATIDVGDSLNISDAGEAIAHAYEIDNNSVDRSGGPSVAYMAIEALNLFAGSAVDAASVTMPTAPFTIANPALPSIVSFDGGSPTGIPMPPAKNAADMFKIYGTDGADKIIVGNKATDPATRSPFEINEVEFVKLRGGNASPVLPNSDTGFDDLVNMTGARGLLEGFAGNDIHFGGSDIDVIAAGAGADYLAGNGGNDYLFADVDLVNTSPVTGVERIPDPTGLGDLLDGGAGTNTGFQKGSLDIAAGISGALFDGGACKNVITWLQAQIVGAGAVNSGETLNSLVTKALNALQFDWGLQANASSSPPTNAVPNQQSAIDPDNSTNPMAEGNSPFVGPLPWDGRVVGDTPTVLTQNAASAQGQSGTQPAAPATDAATNDQSGAQAQSAQEDRCPYYDNWGGRNEKWVKDVNGQWYFILPNGEMYLPDNGQQATGTNIANVGSAVHADPSILFNDTDAAAGEGEVSLIDLVFTAHADDLAPPLLNRIQPWRNPLDEYDVNQDGYRTALDALILINEINRRASLGESTALADPSSAGATWFFDVTNDNHVSAIDVLKIINALNEQASRRP